MGLAVLGSCAGEQSLAPRRPGARPALAVRASVGDATMMIRTPSAAYGERGGTTLQLEAVVRNKVGHELENKEHVTWRSLGESTVSVDSVTGLATAQDTGLVDVVVDYKYAADTVRLSVVPVPVAAVSVAGVDSLSVDDTTAFTATPLDSAGEALVGRGVAWSSSDAAVATVAPSAGDVVALGVGSTTITATVDGVAGTASLRVWPQPVATVTVAPSSATVPLFRALTLAATLRDRRGKVLGGRAVEWSSSAPAVLTVAASGASGAEATTVDVGEATVTATAEGKAGTATVTVGEPVEARALWVTRFDYTDASGASAAKISTIMQKAASANFNVVYFQVRTAADALYRSDIEPCSPRLCGTLGGPLPFDPLEVALREAAARGIQLHAWVNAYTGWIAGSAFACGQLVESSPRHMLKAHPDWAMVNSAGAPQPCATTAEYVWVSPGIDSVRSRLARVAADIARRYGPQGLKGIHLDRIRFPGTTWSYDSGSVNGYARRYGSAPAAGAAAWNDYRRELVNRGVKEVADSLRAIDPRLVLSAAVFPGYKPVAGWSAQWSYPDLFQDPQAWAQAGALDVEVPMSYAATATSASWTVKSYCSNTDWTCVLDDHRERIERQAGRHVYVGVGAIKGWAEVEREIAVGHARHVNGFSVFDYTKMDAIPNGWALLAGGPFRHRATVPAMPWK